MQDNDFIASCEAVQSKIEARQLSEPLWINLHTLHSDARTFSRRARVQPLLDIVSALLNVAQKGRPKSKAVTKCVREAAVTAGIAAQIEAADIVGQFMTAIPPSIARLMPMGKSKAHTAEATSEEKGGAFKAWEKANDVLYGLSPIEALVDAEEASSRLGKKAFAVWERQYNKLSSENPKLYKQYLSSVFHVGVGIGQIIARDSEVLRQKELGYGKGRPPEASKA
jgi:hypothetical protein